MTDIVTRLRSLYVDYGTNYVQEAADMIEAAHAVGIRQEQTIMDHEREIERLRGVASEAAEAATQHQAAVLRLRADALRYSWLRDNFTRLVVDTLPGMPDGRRRVIEIMVNDKFDAPDTASVDAAVDAAIRAQD